MNFEEDLIIFSSTARLFYRLLIYPIVAIGLIGNFAVLIRIFLIPGKTSLKPFYRTSLISLAFSDLLLLGTSGTNVLSILSSKTILWSLGEWSCSILPFFQTIAILVASLTLAGVAIDRFCAFRSKFAISKGPGWIQTLSYILLMWTLAVGASYPVLALYEPHSLNITNNATMYTGILCVANREKARTTYTGLFVVIFLPLAIIFVIVHIMLALSIWERKCNSQATGSESNFSNENSTASTNIEESKRKTPKRKIPTPTHVIRKRRTVKVLLLLILIFAICRLPNWTFLLFKLHTTVNGLIWWHVQILFTGLTLLNAAMHPFLYAFLNEALSLVHWIQLICCNDKESINIETSQLRMKDGSSSERVKVPRGPYSP